MSENICIINAKSGVGTSSPQISQFTHNCDCIKFIIDKDFTNYALVIITSINGEVSVVSEGDALVKSFNSDANETTVLWYPSGEITFESGCVIYQLAAYDAQTKDTIWYSKEGRLIVTDSIDTTDYSTAAVGSSPNLVTQLLTLVKSLELDVTNLSDTKVNKEEGKMLTSNDFTNEQKAALEKAAADIANNSEKISQNEQTLSDHREELNEHKGRIDFAEDNISHLKTLAEENKGEESYDPQSTKAQSGMAVAQAIAAIVNSAPQTLDTLEELAAALGDDPNFATTIMTLLGGKVDKTGGKEQLGLGKVDNTADIDKPISAAVSEALAQKLDIDTYENEKQLMVNEIDSKVDSVSGKGLSTNDFTNEYKYMLDYPDLVIEQYLNWLNEPEYALFIPLSLNKQHICGEKATVRIECPSDAKAGDVVYLSFISGNTPTNLTIDTTNTCDIELIPEANTHYEIFGKFNGSIWLINYSEYTVSEVV